MEKEKEKENEDRALKSQIVLLRCAKVALLLFQLKSLPTLPLQDNAINYPNEVKFPNHSSFSLFSDSEVIN